MHSTATQDAETWPTSGKPILVGIDDGYACTKLALPDGRLLAIPSTARVGRSKVSWMPTAEPKVFEYQAGEQLYSVGDVDGESTRFDEYAESGLNRVIVQHALQCADLEGRDVVAVSGLPVSVFYRPSGVRRRSAIERKRQSLLEPVQPKSGAMPVAIVEHDVIPEALAAWYDHVIEEQGESATLLRERIAAPIAVIDIGGQTTDTVVVHSQGVDHQASASAAVGVLDARQTFADRLEERFDIGPLPEPRLSRAFECGTLRLYSDDHDVTVELNKAKAQLVERLYAAVRRQLGSGADFDVVLIVGGGALALREHLTGWFPNQRMARQPAFANARGILKYLRHVRPGAASEN